MDRPPLTHTLARRLRRLSGPSALACALAVAACSAGADGGTGGSGTTTSERTARPAPTASTLLDVPAVSFTEEGPPVDLGDGWTVSGCEGDAPMLCVSRHGVPAGRVEVATFPVGSFDLPGFRKAMADGNHQGALEVVAADFVRTFEADRSGACGTDYEIAASPVEAATVLGGPGIRYGYRGTKGGTVVEVQVSHATIDGDTVVLVNTPAYAEGGCVPPEGEFEPAALDEFVPRLRALVATAQL